MIGRKGDAQALTFPTHDFVGESSMSVGPFEHGGNPKARGSFEGPLCVNLSLDTTGLG